MKCEIVEELSIESDNFAPREVGPKGFYPPGRNIRTQEKQPKRVRKKPRDTLAGDSGPSKLPLRRKRQ